MSARIYLIMGPPGSGKSTLFKNLDAVPDFPHKVITKITTRRERETEGTEIISVKGINRVQMKKTDALISFVNKNNKYYSFDDIKGELVLNGTMYFSEKKSILETLSKSNEIDKASVEKLYQLANKFPVKYDFVYEQYTLRYGLASSDIQNCLSENKSPIVIVNDIRTLQDLKNYFGDLVVCLFIFRNLEAEDIEAMQKSRGAIDSTGKIDEEQTKKRINKVNVIFRSYIENINLFNYVILNTTNYEDMKTQMSEIVTFYRNLDKMKMLKSGIKINA
jgi:guanylate kinase